MRSESDVCSQKYLPAISNEPVEGWKDTIVNIRGFRGSLVRIDVRKDTSLNIRREGV